MSETNEDADEESEVDEEGEEEYGEKFWDNLDENDLAGWEDNMNKE